MTNDKWLEAKIRTDLGIAPHKEPNYTAAQLLWLSENRTLTLSQLTAQFNQTFGTDYKVSRLNSLRKRHGWSSGRDGRFPKGHIPANKGRRTPGKYLNATQFKIGAKPHNTMPVGTIVVRADGYKQTKIAEPNNWRLTHILEWEKVNGPIPKGYLIKFLDGDQLNTDPANMVLITRAEMLRLNHHRYNQMPDELKPAVMSLAKLEVKTFSLSKN